MKAIDADAHIDESEATWEYLDESEQALRPVGFELPQTTKGFSGFNARQNRMWIIGGNARLHRFRDDKQTQTTQATRELLDIPERLRHMDQLGIDVQVLYPTTLLHAVTSRPEVEAAVCKTYNRWIADRTSSSGGRLRWAAQIPMLDMEAAVKEARWAKDNGACCIMKRGVEFGQRSASDPYNFPLYEECNRLDLPIAFHQGTADPTLSNALDTARMAEFNVLSAFFHLAGAGIPDRFPKVRFGFVEAGASWIPYLIKSLGMRGKAQKAGFDWKTGFLAHNRFYVTCDTEDDLSAILPYGAEDHIMIGTDYSHADQSAEIRAHSVIMERGEKGQISKAAAQKIVEDNGRALYGL